MIILNNFSIETIENDFISLVAADSDTYFVAIRECDSETEQSAQFTKEELIIFANKILAVIESN